MKRYAVLDSENNMYLDVDTFYVINSIEGDYEEVEYAPELFYGREYKGVMVLLLRLQMTVLYL